MMLLQLLFLLLTCSACWFSRQTNTTATLANASQESVLYSLEEFSDPQDPRRAWLEDLQYPRLSRFESDKLPWTCSRDARSFFIDTRPLGLNCADLLSINNIEKFRFSCVDKDTIEISGTNQFCRLDTPPSKNILASIRVSPEKGFVVRSEHTRIIFRNLLDLASPKILEMPIEKDVSKAHWQSPPSRLWWAQTHPEGALQIDLLLPSNASSSAAILNTSKNLVEFIKRIREPSALRLFRDSYREEKNFQKTKLPLVILQHPYVNPLFAETCRYIETWIRSNQVIAPEMINEKEQLTLDCRINWSPHMESVEEANEGLLMTLTRIAIPLYNSQNNQYFPLKTSSEALSPAQLGNMLTRQ